MLEELRIAGILDQTDEEYSNLEDYNSSDTDNIEDMSLEEQLNETSHFNDEDDDLSFLNEIPSKRFLINLMLFVRNVVSDEDSIFEDESSHFETDYVAVIRNPKGSDDDQTSWLASDLLQNNPYVLVGALKVIIVTFEPYINASGRFFEQIREVDIPFFSIGKINRQDQKDDLVLMEHAAITMGWSVADLMSVVCSYSIICSIENSYITKMLGRNEQKGTFSNSFLSVHQFSERILNVSLKKHF